MQLNHLEVGNTEVKFMLRILENINVRLQDLDLDTDMDPKPTE
jgi:hypothetical protein